MSASWIWLPSAVYPENQNTRFDTLSKGNDGSYLVAEFKKLYNFDKTVAFVKLCFSADTEFQLFCNDKLIATGPPVVGGDFLGNGEMREWYYAYEMEFVPTDGKLDFFARVKMCPVLICEYSKGHGRFMLFVEVVFEDGSREHITTDNSWMVRKNGTYVKPFVYDGTILPDPYVQAEVIPDIWDAEVAPIPPRTEEEIHVDEIELAPGEKIDRILPLDMIYAGFCICRQKQTARF